MFFHGLIFYYLANIFDVFYLICFWWVYFLIFRKITYLRVHVLSSHVRALYPYPYFLVTSAKGLFLLLLRDATFNFVLCIQSCVIFIFIIAQLIYPTFSYQFIVIILDTRRNCLFNGFWLSFLVKWQFKYFF